MTNDTAKKIAIIGLGRCGMPAVAKFLAGGYQVIGRARRPEVIAKLKEIGGIAADSPAHAASLAQTIIIMVLNDAQVIEVVCGPSGILEGAAPGSTVICMSTINRDNLQLVYDKCTEKKIHFVDCPFTGGPARITAGTLTLIAAAAPKVLESVRPHLEIIGKITLAGPTPGMGQAIKHCNQLLVTAVHAATVELMILAEKSGVDPALTCEVIGSGIAGNDYFRLLSKAILTNTDSPGGMGQLHKDVNIAVTSGRRYNLPLLVATATAQYFNMAVAQGLEKEDSARLFNVMRKMIGD